MAGCGMAHAQLAAVKTNALLWGNLTPNISMELVTASKFSLEGTVFYGLNKTPLDAQLKGAQAEFRYWIAGRPMARTFIGLSVSGVRYTVVHKGKAHQGSCRTGTDVRLCLAAEQTVQPGILGRSGCPVVQGEKISGGYIPEKRRV